MNPSAAMLRQMAEHVPLRRTLGADYNRYCSWIKAPCQPRELRNS